MNLLNVRNLCWQSSAGVGAETAFKTENGLPTCKQHWCGCYFFFGRWLVLLDPTFNFSALFISSCSVAVMRKRRCVGAVLTTIVCVWHLEELNHKMQELLKLLEENLPPERPLIPASRINFHNLPNSCHQLFRVQNVEQLFQLADALRLPQVIITSQSDRSLRHEALAILLRKCAFPVRWSDLVNVFGSSEARSTLILSTHLY